jgi:hypothetical protein
LEKREVKTDFRILPNPHYQVSPETYKEYHEFMSGMEVTLNDMHKKVNTIYRMRQQLEEIINDMGEDQKYAALKKEGELLAKKMKAWDEDMVQRKSKAYDDVENYSNKFTANFMFLINQTESEIPVVTQPSRDRHAELMKEWTLLDARAKEITEKDVPAYTKKLWEAGMGAVRTPGN